MSESNKAFNKVMKAALSQPAEAERNLFMELARLTGPLPEHSSRSIDYFEAAKANIAQLRAENERLNRELELSRAAASAEALHADELQAELAERRGKYRDADVEDLIAVAEAARSRLYALLPANSIGPRIWQVIKALKETERTVSE